jgi:transcriptional regulator with XRE-family HTH domain
MVNEAIYTYLKENGIRQSHLASKSGIHQPKLSQSLNGKRKLSPEEYFSICRALNVPLDKFAPAAQEVL